MLDLYNREIVGYSAGIHKDARLVCEAFLSINHRLHSSLEYKSPIDYKNLPLKKIV